MQPPVAPQVQGSDVKSLGDQTGVKQWKPGDAVTVTGDLKEDAPETQSQEDQGPSPQQSQNQTALKPTVLPPVQPQVREDDLRGLTTSKAYRPGQPVRVIEDLKESGSEN